MGEKGERDDLRVSLELFADDDPRWIHPMKILGRDAEET